MIRALIALLLAVSPLASQIIAPSIVARQSTKIAPGSFQNIERHFNAQLSSLFDANEPMDLLGLMHGVQIDGFGVIFTAEVSLVRTPGLSPFQQTISKEVAARVRSRKTERLPFLTAIMKEMMKRAAATFIQVPDDQQVVIAVRFLYEPWEDRTGMPYQVQMRATRAAIAADKIQVEVQ